MCNNLCLSEHLYPSTSFHHINANYIHKIKQRRVIIEAPAGMTLRFCHVISHIVISMTVQKQNVFKKKGWRKQQQTRGNSGTLSYTKLKE